MPHILSFTFHELYLSLFICYTIFMVFAEEMLGAIGNTPLVKLNKIVPENSANVFVKLEFSNPTGSMKDRVAKAMIECAEKDGRLKKGFKVLEYTGGSTGTSLAFVCALKGYPITLITSDAFSDEKINSMKAFGAEIILIPSEGGVTTKNLIEKMIEKAKELSKEPRTFWTNQLYNKDGASGYFKLGEEILKQMEGKVDCFIQAVGTAHSINGVGSVLKKYNPDILVYAVEPQESPVLSGGNPGPHDIEGIGIGFKPPLWDPEIVDGVIPVSTIDAKKISRVLAYKEGIFSGTSSGANVFASLKIAEKIGKGKNIVTLIIDSGLKYLSTDLYNYKGDFKKYEY